MPEIAEVEVLRRQLEKEYVGKKVRKIEVKTRQYVKEAKATASRVIRKNIAPKAFGDRLVDGKVKGVHRKGKFLAFELDSGNHLVFHLGMSGHIVKASPKRPPDKHTHVTVQFSQGGTIRFFDARKFGECFVASREDYEAAMDGLGIDAVSEQIPWQLFGEMVAERSVKMKRLLMDQGFISGLGNIYSDEVLFLAGLAAERTSDTLTSNETRRLARAIGEVLQDAIKHRGTTLEDGEWRDLFDEPGEHQEHLAVYSREGEPCRRCRTPIERVRYSQRSHYFCSQCQSLPD